MSEGSERRRRAAAALSLAAAASTSFLLGWARPKHDDVKSPAGAVPLEIGRRRLSGLSIAQFKDPKSMSLRSSRAPPSSGFPAEEERYARVGGARRTSEGMRRIVHLLAGGGASSNGAVSTPNAFENEMGEYRAPPTDEELPPQNGRDQCVPAKAWHSYLRVNCNSFHEVEYGLDHDSNSEDGFVTYLSAGGRRDTYAYETRGDATHGSDEVGDRMVLKLLRMEKRDWTERCFDLQRRDALALELATHSPHVIDTYGFCGTSTFNEYAGNGNVQRYLWTHGDGIEPEELLLMARNISTGLADVHEIGTADDPAPGDAPGAPMDVGTILQNDLRPFNLLMTDDDRIKLSDFNAAKFLEWDVDGGGSCGFGASTTCGRNVWGSDRSPEECRGGELLTQKLEVYVLGNILHILLTKKKYPYIDYESKDRLVYTLEGDDSEKSYSGEEISQEIQKLIVEGVRPPLTPEVLDIADNPAIKAIIRARDAAMTYDVDERPNARGIANMLEEAASSLRIRDGAEAAAAAPSDGAEAAAAAPSDREDSAFACLPREDEAVSPPKHLSPLVIFGEPRVGSNLFFNMMRERNILAARNSGGHPYDVEIMGLYDFFHGTAEKDQMQANKVLKKVQRDCRSESGGNITGLPTKLEAALDAKYDNPRVMFDALDGLPSYADKGYYTFKIFSEKIKNFLKGGDPSTLVQAASNRKYADAAPAKYIVMWRRRMIESFVSEELAVKTGARTSRSKHYLGEEAPKIFVKKEKMEEYIDTQKRYYESVKRALRDAGVTEYLVLEYGADFLEAEQHLATVRKLESFLGASGDSLAETTVARLGHEKQQKGDISTAVENWDEVVKLGWGGELEEWEDLFESHENPDH